MAKAKNGWVATDRYKQALVLLRGRSGVMYNDAICSKANGPGRSIKISAADKRFHTQLGELADRVVVTPSYRNAYGQAGLNVRYHFYMNGKPRVCKTSPKRTSIKPIAKINDLMLAELLEALLAMTISYR